MILAFSIILFLLFIFILWLLLICPSDAAESMTAPFLGRAYAHRGLYSSDQKIPENSLAAFRNAVHKGYGIELDITITKDHQVVVFHDDTLDRMCGVSGKITEQDYAFLSQLKLSSTGETIPLLSTVLALVDGSVPLIIEFKHVPNTKVLVEEAYKLLAEYKGAYCVESFDPFILWRLRGKNPKLFRGQLSSRMEGQPNSPLAFILRNLLLNILSRPHFIAYDHTGMRSLSYRAAVHLLHAIPVAWTVKCAEDFYRLYDTGIDIQIFEGFLPPAFITEKESI